MCFISDTIFFHLPSRTEKHKTVYGVACYRQIDAKVCSRMFSYILYISEVYTVISFIFVDINFPGFTHLEEIKVFVDFLFCFIDISE